MLPLLVRIRTLLGRSRMERELDAELQFHLDMLTAQYVEQGMPRDRARREARQVFGGVDRIKDDVRDTWLGRLIETFSQDARYGVRGLRKNAGYAIAVIATMALGVGANTAIFSVVNAVVLQPLPYSRGEDLVLLRQSTNQASNRYFSLEDIKDVKVLSTSLDAVVEYHDMYFILVGASEPARVSTGVVSWDYFDTLGIEPVLGQTFQKGDDDHGAQATLLLSHEYWTRAFDRDPNVIGRVFQMNDRPHTVVGVLPDVPMYPGTNDVYMPRSACPFRMNPQELTRRGSGMALALGRQRPGVTSEELEADLNTVAAKLQDAYPNAYPVALGHQLTATPLRREFTREFDATLLILLSTSGFVLLIVCASVANLAVARTMRRDQELRVRTALGASRGRILRQLATEGAILAVAGAVAALAIAFAGMDLLVAYAQRFTARASEIRIDATVFGFTLAISLAAGLVSGILPALSTRRPPRMLTRKLSGGTTSSHDLRRALIVAQIGASFVLLIGAGLMLRSLWKLSGVDPGFSTKHVLTWQIDVDFTRYFDHQTRAAYLDRLAESVRAVPGVSYVGATGAIPFHENAGGALEVLQIEGIDTQDSSAPRAQFMVASEDYFHAMGIPIVRGRPFIVDDDGDSAPVALVNATLAAHYWPNSDPLGRRVSFNGGRHWATIVGVVADVRQQLAFQPVEEVYIPLRQMPWVTTNWAVSTDAPPETIAPLVRNAIRAVNPDQPIHRMRPLEELRLASLISPRLTTTLLGLFATLALVITAAGIAGVIAYSVSQRTQEFGVRVALGARRADVASMVLVEGVRLAARGLALGIVGALLLSGLISTLLFNVAPTDAMTYFSVSVVLLAAAALACLLPALRAASVDAMQALRAA